MDFKNRLYYKVKFQYGYENYRIESFKCFKGVTASKRKGFVLISCNKDSRELIEYELRKSERRDGYCEWIEVNDNE